MIGETFLCDNFTQMAFFGFLQMQPRCYQLISLDCLMVSYNLPFLSNSLGLSPTLPSPAPSPHSTVVLC